MAEKKKAASVGGDYPYMAKFCGIIAAYAQLIPARNFKFTEHTAKRAKPNG